MSDTCGMEWGKTIEKNLDQLRDKHVDSHSQIIGKKQKLAYKRPLPTSALARIREKMNIAWPYNSNGI